MVILKERKSCSLSVLRVKGIIHSVFSLFISVTLFSYSRIREDVRPSEFPFRPKFCCLSQETCSQGYPTFTDSTASHNDSFFQSSHNLVTLLKNIIKIIAFNSNFTKSFYRLQSSFYFNFSKGSVTVHKSSINRENYVPVVLLWLLQHLYKE